MLYLQKFQKVLFIQTAFLGDVILSFPTLRALKKAHPNLKIALVARKGLGPFLKATGLVDLVIEIDKKNAMNRAEAFGEMEAFGADLLISAHESVRTALIVKRLAIRQRVGFHKWWNFWAYNHRVIRDLKLHDVLRQMSLLQVFDLSVSSEPRDLLTKFPATGKFQGYKNAVALAPGSQWPTKRWTVEGFRELAKMHAGDKVLLLGDPTERSVCEAIRTDHPHVENLAGMTSLLELAEILSQCRILYCNDSGAMHVASSVGCPVVTVFGPTVPNQGYSPWNLKSQIVETDLSCRPCGKHGHTRCPIGTHDCMRKISAQQVRDAAQRLGL